MQAQELRIGNWLITERGIAQKVAYIGETIGFENETFGTDKHQKNPIFSFDIDKIQPIILTPEILEKCGFVFKPEGYEVYEQTWSKDGFSIWQHSEGFCHDFHTGGDVIYLHQLQNLYYCLVGEELEVRF